MNPHIPKEEFFERVSNAQELMKLHNIDIIFAFGNEAEPQYQKYFSNFWPAFETAGVLIAQEGEPVLLVGPESKKRGLEQHIITDVRCMAAFRESSSPQYTGIRLDSFNDVIDDILKGKTPKVASIAGARLLPFDIYLEFKESLEKYGDVQIINDQIVDTLRMTKSENELACIQRASEISAETMHYLINNITANMTELQIKGLALSRMYELGAENEAFPMWVLSGKGCDYAIGRARQKKVQNGELIQLQIGARYEGYASTIARPIILGKAESWMTDSIKALYDGQEAVLSQLIDGNNASIAAAHFKTAMKKNGFYNQLLYGPCHGLGIMECEAPWIEEDSDYILKKGMSFGVDLYIENPDQEYSMRVEDTVCVDKTSSRNMTCFPREIFIL